MYDRTLCREEFQSLEQYATFTQWLLKSQLITNAVIEYKQLDNLIPYKIYSSFEGGDGGGH